MLFKDLSTLCLSGSGNSMFAIGISPPHHMCQRRLQILMQVLIILTGLCLIFFIATCTEIHFISPWNKKETSALLKKKKSLGIHKFASQKIPTVTGQICSAMHEKQIMICLGLVIHWKQHCSLRFWVNWSRCPTICLWKPAFLELLNDAEEILGLASESGVISAVTVLGQMQLLVKSVRNTCKNTLHMWRAKTSFLGRAQHLRYVILPDHIRLVLKAQFIFLARGNEEQENLQILMLVLIPILEAISLHVVVLHSTEEDQNHFAVLGNSRESQVDNVLYKAKQNYFSDTFINFFITYSLDAERPLPFSFLVFGSGSLNAKEVQFPNETDEILL